MGSLIKPANKIRDLATLLSAQKFQALRSMVSDYDIKTLAVRCRLSGMDMGMGMGMGMIMAQNHGE